MHPATCDRYNSSIYIVSNKTAWPGYWKIGHSFDPIKRIRSFNIGSPFRDYVINATYPFNSSYIGYVESEIHRILNEYSTNVLGGRKTEWFGKISFNDLINKIESYLKYKNYNIKLASFYEEGILNHRGSDEGVIDKNKNARTIVNTWSYDEFCDYVYSNKLLLKPTLNPPYYDITTVAGCGGRVAHIEVVVKHLQNKLDEEE